MPRNHVAQTFCLASRSARTWKRRRHSTEIKHAFKSTNPSGWGGLLGRSESGSRRSTLRLFVSLFLRGDKRVFPHGATLVIGRTHLDLDEGSPTRRRRLGHRWSPDLVGCRRFGLVWFGKVGGASAGEPAGHQPGRAGKRKWAKWRHVTALVQISLYFGDPRSSQNRREISTRQFQRIKKRRPKRNFARISVKSQNYLFI